MLYLRGDLPTVIVRLLSVIDIESVGKLWPAVVGRFAIVDTVTAGSSSGGVVADVGSGSDPRVSAKVTAEEPLVGACNCWPRIIWASTNGSFSRGDIQSPDERSSRTMGETPTLGSFAAATAGTKGKAVGSRPRLPTEVVATSCCSRSCPGCCGGGFCLPPAGDRGPSSARGCGGSRGAGGRVSFGETRSGNCGCGSVDTCGVIVNGAH